MRNFLKKKNKLLKIIATFVLLLSVIYACEKEFWNSTWAEEEAQTIDQAKAWYATNKPEETLLRSSNEKIKIPAKPEWSHAFTTKNKDYKVVETDISSQGRLLFIDTACMAKYKETNDLKYRQCYTRMVFRIDLNTNDTVGFLMTVVPNLDWLEKSKFKPFMDVTYLYRSKQFGGEVLFHNLDGTFSNGWLYEKGKIVATVSSMDADPAEFSLRSTECQTVANYNVYEICTDYYTVHEDGDEYTGTSCTGPIWEFTGYSQVCTYVPDSSPNSGGYTGGGTNPTNPTDPTNQTQNPCSNGASGNATNNHMLTDSKVKTNMDDILSKKTSSIDEWSVGIGTNPDGSYNVTAPQDNPRSDNGVERGSVPIPSGNFVASGHSHNGMGVPSSGDLYSFLEMVQKYPYMQTMYVYGIGYKIVNGTTVQVPETYAINVYDRNAVTAFLNSFPKTSNLMHWIIGNDDYYDGWIPDTKLYNDYYSTIGFNSSGSYTFLNDAVSLSFIMNKYNMGVTLSMEQDGGSFKIVNAQQDSSGKTSVSTCGN